MIDIAAGIARYLEGRVFGRVYCDFLPEAPDEAAAVYEYQGTAQYCGAGHGEGAIRRDIQIRVRAKSRAAAFSAANEAYRLLDSGAEERTVLLFGVPSVVRPTRPPVLFERDSMNRAIFAWELSVVTGT